ncbi:cytochrome P450 alkane hydroxylase-like protein [Nemania sp. FL0031]|nr:cytochrome P450 alkane hydroxylase-like protein [Nemania sp. FL0031]
MDTVWTTIIALGCIVAIAFYERIHRRNSARTQGNFRPLVQYQPFDLVAGSDFSVSIHKDLFSLHRQHQQLGRSFQLNTLSSTPTIFTIEPQNLQAINSRDDEWGIQPNRLAGMEFFCGRGFLTMDGDEWRHSRKCLRPSFARSNLMDLSVLSGEMDKLLEKLPQDGSTVNLQPLLYAMFLNTSLNFLLGISSDEENQKAPCTTEEFVDAFHSALFMTMVHILVGKAWRLVPKSKYFRVCKRAHEFLDHYIQLAIGESRNTEQDSGKSKTLIQNLSSVSEDKSFIRSQVIQGMMASQETTSSLLGNVFFLLARNQEYWRKVRHQVLEIDEGVLRFEALRENKLLRNIIFETLRLYPIFPLLSRVALRDTSLPLGGGPEQDASVFVPKGTTVQMGYFALHRDPAVFGDDVETFRPERWDSISPGQWDFMPFGGGMRACLGREKSLIEASFVLASMALRFSTLESRDGREWKSEMKLTCQNANGCLVSFYI